MRQLRSILGMIVAILTLFPSPGFATSLRVSWIANSEADLEGYKVYYGVQSGTYYPAVDVGNVTSYQIDNVQNGTTYYIRVTAHDNSQNESGPSPEQSVSIPVPDTTPPTGNVAINSGAATTTSSAVTLTLSASDAGGLVTGMRLSNDGVTYSSEVAYATSYPWTLTSGYGTKTVYVLFKDSSGNSMTSPATDTIQFVNPCPVANAGANQNVPPQRVILDGSASYDPGNLSLQYGWTQVSGPVQVIIETPTSSVASFMGIKAGLYRFKLTCSNGSCTNTATVDVTIQNVAPSVNAGGNMTINAGTQITLHATGQDPNEDSLTYQWTKVSGPSVTIPSMAQQDITFTPTNAGLYTFSVQCYDGVNYSATSQVNVTVNAVNHAPTANAGPNQDVNVGSTVTLNGTGSTDPDGDSLSYSWIQSSGPVQITLNGATTAQPKFAADTVGTYQFNLTVNDGKVNSTPSSVTIRVVAQNNAPIANAGPDMHAYVGDDVVLNASSSFDPDLDPITYNWIQVSGATVVIFNANTPQPFFTPTTSGVFEFKVTASDGQASATDNVMVTVDNHNQVPVADAGANMATLMGDTVTLDGSKSSDPDGTTISYIWSQTGGPMVSLNSSNSATPSFVPTQTGVYVFELRVYDGIDTSSPASVTVTVQDKALEVTLTSPALDAAVSQNPLLTWAGKGFSSYKTYISINGGKRWQKIYNGGGSSCTLHPALWNWFIPSGTAITWYVEGSTVGNQGIKSSTGRFIKK
jgi:hypothetical protein